MSSLACRICRKDCSDIIKCDKCQSTYYCSEICKINDASDHNKICIQRLDDEKLTQGKELQSQLQKSIQTLKKDFLGWKNTKSYKTGNLTDFMIIDFNDDGTIITIIGDIYDTMKPKINLFWPKINPKESIPIMMRGSKVSAMSRINLWPGY